MSNGGVAGFPKVFYNMSCVFESTDSTPVEYANVNITDLGAHCMLAGGKCPNNVVGYALAANFNIQPISASSGYAVTNKNSTGNNPDTQWPYATAYACDGKICAQQWTGQIYNTLTGSVTINNTPQDLQVHCTKPNQFSVTQVHDDPSKGTTIDFQQTHDAQSTDATADVTADCTLTSQGKNYGSLELQGINGSRTQNSYPAHMWSAIVSVKTQPDSSTNTTLATPTSIKDEKQHFGCSADGHCNNWSVNMNPSAYAGSLTVTGAPSALTVTGCSSGVKATAHAVNDDPQKTIIDFKTNVYDQVTTQPGKIISPTCNLEGADGASYGKVTFSNLSDTYISTAHPESHLWAAALSVAAQPEPKTNSSLSTPIVAQDSDSDSSGQYHNLWTANITTRAYMGSLNITGGSKALVAQCKQDLAEKTVPCSIAPSNDEPSGCSVDFETVHDAFAPNDPVKTISPICTLIDANTQQIFGAVDFTDLNGNRDDSKSSETKLWSAKLTKDTTIKPTADATLSDPQVGADDHVDSSGQYHTSWAASIAERIAGSITISGAPEALKIACGSAPVLETKTLNLKTVHDAVSGDPNVVETINCSFQGATSEGYYGVITVANVKGTYASKNTPNASLWAAMVSAAGQPTTGYHLTVAIASGSDSDPTGAVHNLWTVTFSN